MPQHLEVTGKGDKPRTIPIDPTLEEVLDAYQTTRTARFPDDG